MTSPSIQARNLKIADSVKFGKNVRIVCESITLGENSYIGDNVTIECREFSAGEYLYMMDNVQIGRGGKFGENSRVIIGDHVGIFESTIINPSESVHIGNNVGIGAEVMIWTHGAWLDVLEGFPSQFGSVSIEDNVWLPARSIVLPGVRVGKNTVITINSVINRDLPEGCLAGGNPAKVIKENVYPKKSVDKFALMKRLCTEHESLIKYKLGSRAESIKYALDYNRPSDTMTLNVWKDNTLDCKGRVTAEFSQAPYTWSVTCEDDFICDIFEDLRDFLRRNGVRIFTGSLFRSLPPYFL